MNLIEEERERVCDFNNSISSSNASGFFSTTMLAAMVASLMCWRVGSGTNLVNRWLGVEGESFQTPGTVMVTWAVEGGSSPTARLEEEVVITVRGREGERRRREGGGYKGKMV